VCAPEDANTIGGKVTVAEGLGEPVKIIGAEEAAANCPSTYKLTDGESEVELTDGIAKATETVKPTGWPTSDGLTEDEMIVVEGIKAAASVKLCVASIPTPLWAVRLMVYVPAVPPAGVPLKVAVPLWLSTKLTPVGRAPNSDRLGVGNPTAATVNELAVPNWKVA